MRKFLYLIYSFYDCYNHFIQEINCLINGRRRPRMGRAQGGDRAAFATLSWGPARKTYFLELKMIFRRLAYFSS